MKTVIEMAREAGWMHEHDSETGFVAEAAFKFAELVRADALAEQPAQPLPFGVGGGLVAIKTLLSRDPCVHANTAIQMIDSILAEQPAHAPVEWMEMVVANLVREGVNKHKARELAQHFYTSPPAQPMHPEIKKMYEDYFDKCFRESSAAVPENFMDALKFDVAMRECVMEPAQDSGIVTAGGFDPRTQRTWVGLTDEEFQMIYDMGRTPAGMMEMVEAKLKEKNT